MKKIRILGIDPGTAIVGYGIIDWINNEYKVIEYGCIYTEKHKKPEARLLEIYKAFEKLIKLYEPNEIAVEDLFFNKNAKTALSVGQARGVILLLSAKMKIPIASYTPLQVKQGITSYGRSSKEDMQQMVKFILNLEEIPKPDDAADGLAIAITHINSLVNLGLK